MSTRLESMIQSKQFEDYKHKVENEDGFFKEHSDLSSRFSVIKNHGSFLPIMDLSPAAQEFYLCRYNQQSILDEPNYLMSANLINGWLFLTPEIISFEHIQNRVLNDSKYVEYVSKLESRLRTDITNQLNITSFRHLDRGGLLRLFNDVASYTGLLLNYLVEYTNISSVLKETSPKSEGNKLSSFLYPSEEVPYYYIIYTHLLKLSIETLKYGFSKSSAESFAGTVGYLERIDLRECRFEKLNYIEECVKTCLSTQKTVKDLEEERETLFKNRMIARSNATSAYRFLLNYFGKKSKYRQAKNSLNFIKLSLNYGERNRKIRTLFFKTLEKWFIDHNQDPMVSILPKGIAN